MSLFASILGRLPKANAVNEAGGLAYQLEPKHALAQVAATGTFNNAFYSTAESQLDEVLKLIDTVDDNQYLAKLALYAREKAFMKDMPAALLVALSVRDTELMHRVFDRVVDNGRVLRTVFQMIRSGQFKNKAGKSRVGLSSSVQRAFQRWLNTASVGKLLSASIGNDPSLRDILRMARPTPKDNARRAMFGWLTDKSIDKWAPATEADLPVEVQSLIAYRKSESEEAQALIAGGLDIVRWDLLSDAARGPKVWAVLARKMGPQALRMNLNTLLRHDVLATSAMVDYVADRIADKTEIQRSKQFPYQYFAAYLNADDNVPQKIKTALHKAAEIACGNVPELPGPVVIGLDTSGSMSSPVTGNRGRGATSKMRCIDVAALFAAAILRRNPASVVIPFDTSAYDVKIDPNDSILSIAQRLAKYGGGGTDCSLPLVVANQKYARRKFAGMVLVSDNESWVGTGRHGSTGVMTAWEAFSSNQRKLSRKAAPPKLINIDLQPYQTVQACERTDIMNIGGFSDAVFNVISAFLADNNQRFVAEVEAIEL
ncbi:TROVE domain protein [Planctopirus limnophila DSM 3776]|uniref:TROVE domain protein n=2 Tax=Planctopirus limnophila TaxID=120 RepID=D5SQA2_PLAL2|nr:TROVE domain-containing protein [Planctopirus limnophila]ADG66354.1 TROVE domain protein [Planctopirus limnophila DSM 3776]